MYFSKAFIPTLKEAPSDMDNISAKLMVRSGMIRKLASGFFEGILWFLIVLFVILYVILMFRYLKK